MMKKLLIVSLLVFSPFVYSTCHNDQMIYAPALSIDLTDKLTSHSPVWTTTLSTQYIGTFKCNTRRESTFGYTKTLSTNDRYATIIGFKNNQYKVRAEIINDIPNKEIDDREMHNASELNQMMEVRFSLVDSTESVSAINDSHYISDVMFVTDLSDLSLVEIIKWPVVQLGKFLTWLTNGFHWPYDKYDMFGQPMIITYQPKSTTCSFDNAGLTVTLPTVGINQILSSERSGYTPFSLNISCKEIGANNRSDRAIDIFLSSNQLLSTDHSVLIDDTPDGAKGVGLRLIKRDNLETPVMISSTSTSRGTASSLFNINSGGILDTNFTIPMAVYYYPWDRNHITTGKIRTTAVLNIIYP